MQQGSYRELDVQGKRSYSGNSCLYEYVVHWLRGRIPESIEEVLTFLTRYFTVIELSLNGWVESARYKA